MNFRPLATCSLLVVLTLVGVVGCESRRIGAASWESLELEIVDRESGAPISGVVCSVHTAGRVIAQGTSEGSGQLLLAQSFPQAVTLELEDPKQVYAPRRIEIEEAGQHRIELEKGARAALRVVGEGDAPLAGAEVAVWGPGGTIRRHALHDGRGTLGPLAPGSSKLVVSAPGHASAVLDLRLERRDDGEPVDLKSVRLFPGGATLVGRVDSKPSRRPQSAVLRFSGAGARAAIQPDGRFRFEGLPSLHDDDVSGGAMLVLVRDGEEVYARDLKLSGDVINVGAIEID